MVRKHTDIELHELLDGKLKLFLRNDCKNYQAKVYIDGGYKYHSTGTSKFRQAKKWLISIAVVALFSVILALMIYFMSNGVDVQGGWKEILLLMLGGFVGSFAKVIDFWFNNAEDDVKLLEHADD